MRDKPLTIATYAAGVSLAAITLIYVFGPTYLIDGENTSKTSNLSQKKGVVGLSNPANDCFINSVLQCLAGLGDLRVYLIRETHRRELDGLQPVHHPNEQTANGSGRQIGPATLEGLQRGIVTRALKEVLDSLNERPLYKKTVSAGTFVMALERAFRQRISRQQQDAQEFLQIVAERLSEEYHARQNARRILLQEEEAKANGDGEDVKDGYGEAMAEEDGFPLQGSLESQIECLSCHFKPKPTISTFVTLTLNVPQQSSTTLGNCFDGLLKTEYIDDFKCEKCRLVHAVGLRLQQRARTMTAHGREEIESEISKLEKAIQEDPENPPRDVPLPDIRFAPVCRIAKHVRITSFPKIIAIHLSRSIFDPGSSSIKNSAKVSFPERLPLGGILDRKTYKLLGLVGHKGSHNSGHYESFRRQIVPPPYSTPSAFTNNDKSSRTTLNKDGASSTPSLTATPCMKLDPEESSTPETSSTDSPLNLNSKQSPLPQSSSIPSTPPTSITSCPSTSSNSGRLSTSSVITPPTSAPRTSTETLPSTDQKSLRSTLTKSLPASSLSSRSRSTSKIRNKETNKLSDRWWRISDDRVKESKTSEVLSMQREVYLLFYELEKQSAANDGD